SSSSTPFPYTTLFRSHRHERMRRIDPHGGHQRILEVLQTARLELLERVPGVDRLLDFIVERRMFPFLREVFESRGRATYAARRRSEEHTSELQSRSDL